MDGRGPIEHLVKARHELGAIWMQGIERAASNELFDDAPVYFLRIDPSAELMDRRIGPLLPAALQNDLNGRLSDVFHRSEPEPYHALHDLEGPAAFVHIGRQNADVHLGALVYQLHDLIRAAKEAVHKSRHELDGIMRLEPRGLVCDQGVGRAVRFVEAVLGEFGHEVENVVRLDRIDAIFHRAL